MNIKDELIEILRSSVYMLNKSKIECDITIVGGFAITLLYDDFDRPTSDIDILCDYDEIWKFGFSLQPMDVIENFGDYKNNRIFLENFSSAYVKIYVLKPEYIIRAKEISNREIPDKQDIEFLKRKLEEE